jgi:hypothetical protein
LRSAAHCRAAPTSGPPGRAAPLPPLRLAHRPGARRRPSGRSAAATTAGTDRQSVPGSRARGTKHRTLGSSGGDALITRSPKRGSRASRASSVRPLLPSFEHAGPEILASISFYKGGLTKNSATRRAPRTKS